MQSVCSVRDLFSVRQHKKGIPKGFGVAQKSERANYVPPTGHLSKAGNVRGGREPGNKRLSLSCSN